MQNEFHGFLLLTLKCLKIYKNLRRRTKLLLLLLLLLHLVILNSAGSETVGGAWPTVIHADIAGRPCRRPCCSCSCRVCRPLKPQEQRAQPCPPHPLQRGCGPHNGGLWRPRPLECPPAPALRSREAQGLLS
jgi:hypothetical protein